MLIVAFINRVLLILLISDHLNNQLCAIANPLLSIDQLQWNSVHRNLFGADTVYLPNCIYSCKYLSGSSHLNYSTSNDCLCQCAHSNPVFMPSMRSCVTKLEECKRQVTFEVENHFSRWIPTLSLPSTNNILAPSKPILWKESSVEIDNRTGEANCSVGDTFVLADDLWSRNNHSELFTLEPFARSTYLVWKGSEYDARLLEGTIVQLKLNCYNPNNTSLCLAFRIAGVHMNLKSTTDSGDHQWEHIELITCILLSILLALTVFGSVTLWSVCWRIKKGKLISKIQLQFLYHMKQQQQYMQEQIAVIKANCALHTANVPNVEHLSTYNGIQKRKLYFSADFFEPEQMANPPQLAQHFVIELRKMIETAKERIRLKRHIPTLSTISEEEPENGECLEIKAQNSLNSLQRSDEPSPKSSKSTDSGCDSMSDDDTANSAEAPSHNTNRTSQQLQTEDECAHTVESTTSVSSIQNPFQNSLTIEAVMTPTSDNIPIVTTTSDNIPIVTTTADNIPIVTTTADNIPIVTTTANITAASATDLNATMSTKNANSITGNPSNSTKFSFSSRIPKITYPRIVSPVLSSSSVLPPLPTKPTLSNGTLNSTSSDDLIPNGGLEKIEHIAYRDRAFENKPQKSSNDPPSLQSILNHLPPPLPDTQPPADNDDQQSITQKNHINITTASETSIKKNSNKIRTTTTTTYAVFPSEQMRKKSIPRRSKKIPSVLMISSPIESSM